MKHPHLTKRSRGSKATLGKMLWALCLFTIAHLQINAAPYLVYDVLPWGQNTDDQCMDAVFGSGNWTLANYSTPAATIFQASTPFVMLEGSDNNSNLPAFVTANIALIESWVNSGGRLFINAAPNYGPGNQVWGFGGTILEYDYTNWLNTASMNVTTSVPGDPIFLGPFTPTATSYTGNAFAHGWVNGTGLTSLLYNQAYAPDVRPVLAYKKWGAGVVFFGGCTQPYWWTPSTEGNNIWKNIFSYVNTIPLCLRLTCHNDTTVYTDPASCSAIVNFTPPSGLDSCVVVHDSLFYSGSIVNYIVPAGITSIHILAKGAQGGNGGGMGATMEGDFAVTPGDVLKILVGQQGQTDFIACGQHFGAGGGGGSFVSTSANVPLIVAGGGGGNMCTPTIGMGAVTTQNGLDGYSPFSPTLYGAGGVGGNGATASVTGNGHAGNGGGFYTDGQNGYCGPGGQSFLNGGAGGNGCRGNGGFGGGAAGGNAGGGGGGGYSGGGGSYHFPGNGGGGGSYNAGTNQSNVADNNTGNGLVVISHSSAANAVLTGGLAPGSAFPLGTTTETYRLTSGTDTGYCVFNITVVDTGSPAINCPANVTTCTNVVTGIKPSVTGDNGCTVVTYTLSGATTGSGFDDASGTTFNVGTTTVWYKAANPNGRADSCSFTVTINTPTALLAGNTFTQESVTLDIINPVDVRYTDCDLIAGITPSGAQPLNGPTKVAVTIDYNPANYNGQPYVQRHFDVEPLSSPPGTTATITLYVYGYEFSAYNAQAGPLGLPLLPTNGLDNGNVRVTQFHGVGTAPGNYPGPEELLYPAVSWDATHNWWVLTFSVTDFSGFYVHTAWGPNPLAIHISDIKAANRGLRNRIDWNTSTEDKGDMMTLERSKDGSSFESLYNRAASGRASDYTYWDEKPFEGINYYRVKLTSASGEVSYTKVVNATMKTSGTLTISATPNPVMDKVNVTITGATADNGAIEVNDPTGKKLMQFSAKDNNTIIDMSGLPAGVYFIKYADNNGSVSTRISKL